MIQSPTFEKDETWKTAKWYGTEYKVVDFDAAFKNVLAD